MVRSIGALLRIVSWLNIALGIALALGFVGTFPFSGTMLASLRVHHSPALASAIVDGVRIVLSIGVCAVIATDVILSRLILMVRTVASGDPFIETNANRLKQIAWSLLVLQLLNVGIEYADWHVGQVDGGGSFTFSMTGWVAVLVAFVMTRVFTIGTQMRDDLSGTV